MRTHQEDVQPLASWLPAHRAAGGDAYEAFFELTLRAGRIARRADMAPPR
jgi:hypothetical protein